MRRILTALVGVPLVVGLTWLGGWAFAGMIAFVAVVAQAELYGLASRRAPWPVLVPALGAGAAASLFAMGAVFAALALLLALVALVAFPMATDVEHALPDAASTALGILYPPVLLGCMTALRTAQTSIPDPFWITMGVFLLVWAADSGAYYAGRSLGRHLLAPVVSPKKTWEGVAGGVVAALMVAAALWYWTGSGLDLEHWLVLGGLAAVLGPCGDLFESSLKRSAGVKDSASWLPGHGGFLDRFDALAFVAPAAWLYLAVVVG